MAGEPQRQGEKRIMRDLNRRTLARFGAVGVLTAIGGRAFESVAQTSGSTAGRTVTIKSAAPSLTMAVPLAMAALHLEKAHGFAVDMQASGTSSTLVIDAVVSGQADFGTPGTGDALQAIRQGANIRIVGAIANNLHIMVIRDDVIQKLGVPPTAPIADRVHALKGLTIATSPVGAIHYQILRAYLKQYGLDPDKDVRLVGLGDASALISGIEQKRFDAIAYASGVVEQAIARHAATVWISGPRGDIPGSENVKTCVVVAREDTIEKRRADVDAFRAALTDALHAVRDDHPATGRALHEAYFSKLNPEVWDIAWNGATESYPSSLVFTRAAFDYWVTNDPKGANSYKDVDYEKVVYTPAQS